MIIIVLDLQFFFHFFRCDYANNDKWRIRRHWKSCSKVEKLLGCQIGQCKKRFGTKVALSLHCKREHPENSDFKTGSKPTGNIPHSEPALATQCPNVKSSDDQESQSVQKPVRYTHVLPKPKKGQWIVVLEKLDASNKDSPFNDASNLDEPSTEESKSNQIFELDTSIPKKFFEEIVIKEEWNEHEEMQGRLNVGKSGGASIN